MKRGQLGRKVYLKRKVPMRATNPDRKRRVREKQFGGDGQEADLCRSLPCCVCLAPPPCDPAHVRSRGAGGLRRNNIVPLCRRCHTEQHRVGVLDFEKKHGVDLERVAHAVTALVERIQR